MVNIAQAIVLYKTIVMATNKTVKSMYIYVHFTSEYSSFLSQLYVCIPLKSYTCTTLYAYHILTWQRLAFHHNHPFFYHRTFVHCQDHMFTMYVCTPIDNILLNRYIVKPYNCIIITHGTKSMLMEDVQASFEIEILLYGDTKKFLQFLILPPVIRLVVLHF